MPGPHLGRQNTLRVSARHKAGMLLDGGTLGDILLPRRYVPRGLEPGNEIEVFLALDSEDRPVATTERPLAMVGEFAALKVVDSTQVGAFLDWGMPKDLLLPFSNQVRRLRPGDRALVRICLDQTSGRLVATAKLGKFLADTAPATVSAGDRVSLQIAEQTDLGVKAIVDDLYWGLLPDGSTGRVPAIGERCTGYISRLRDDGLVDLGLEPPGYAKVSAAAEQLAEALAAAEDGFLPVHDKSPPERVRDLLGMSKKVFKQAIGALYKAGRIRISEDGIHLLNR
ncbi:MAG: S1 RNA-binding domain-containing protein [Roseibacillus sp.]